MELNVEGSGINYQYGDHVGAWPNNLDIEFDRLLCPLDLYDKKDTAIDVESLGPALTKVPFPVPTTCLIVLRHYIDTMTGASRVPWGFCQDPPIPAAEEWIKTLATDKEECARLVTNGCLKLAKVLQLVSDIDIFAPPTKDKTTPWSVPFDLIVSSILRFQSRYQISSGPKLYPNSTHITCVIVEYGFVHHEKIPARQIYGVGPNFLLNPKYVPSDDHVTSATAARASAHKHIPQYSIKGPRSLYKAGNIYMAPVHVRRPTFGLPTSPRRRLPGSVPVPVPVSLLSEGSSRSGSALGAEL
jgi:NADPH-ferrihemoprotein reductase